jgi:hypothetical protein
MQITKLLKCFVYSIMILQEGSKCLGKNEFFFNIYNLPNSLKFLKMPKMFWNILEIFSLEFFQASKCFKLPNFLVEMKLFSTYIILCPKLLNKIKIHNLLNFFKHPRKYFSKIFHSA